MLSQYIKCVILSSLWKVMKKSLQLHFCDVAIMSDTYCTCLKHMEHLYVVKSSQNVFSELIICMFSFDHLKLQIIENYLCEICTYLLLKHTTFFIKWNNPNFQSPIQGCEGLNNDIFLMIRSSASSVTKRGKFI